MPCKKCGGPFGKYDVALHLKFINRGAKEYFCLNCLSEFLGMDKEKLLSKVEDFKRNGCYLFLTKDEIEEKERNNK